MTREEAIKILMGYSHTPQERAALEVLIPELAESEDERIRKELKEAFEAYDIESKWNGIPIRSIFAWLEKQKEQKPNIEICPHSIKSKSYTEKPAEWSEEDERNKDRAIFYTRYYQRTNGTTDGSKECIDWLKSLRPQPHWKPSEHQMSMLLAVINDPNNAGSESCHISLESLYDDLKKL